MLFLSHGGTHGFRARDHLRYARGQSVLKVLPHRRLEILIDILHDDLHPAEGAGKDPQPLVPEAKQRILKGILRMDDNRRDNRTCRVALKAVQTSDALLDPIHIPRQIDVNQRIRTLEVASLAARIVTE